MARHWMDCVEHSAGAREFLCSLCGRNFIWRRWGNKLSKVVLAEGDKTAIHFAAEYGSNVEDPTLCIDENTLEPFARWMKGRHVED